jgi:hypothetical protein
MTLQAPLELFPITCGRCLCQEMSRAEENEMLRSELSRNKEVWRPEVYTMKMGSDWYMRTLGPWQIWGSHSSQPWGGAQPALTVTRQQLYRIFVEFRHPFITHLWCRDSSTFHQDIEYDYQTSESKIRRFPTLSIVQYLMSNKPTTCTLLLSYHKFLRW